tara:strand:- start:5607 stop:5906 length:300 start_codon:yes stop_codon:yes gene_type:complete
MEGDPIHAESEKMDQETTVGLLKLELQELEAVHKKLQSEVEAGIARLLRIDVISDTIRHRLKEFGEEPVQAELPEFIVEETEETETVNSGDTTTLEVVD